MDLSSFTHLRLVHCCRTVSVDSYYADGIRVVSRTELAERFREIYSDVSPAAVQAAIGALKRESKEERVDAVIDLRFLIEHASHYLVQGSETLKVFARALPVADGLDPTLRLKSIGRPTAFIIKAPLGDVNKQDLRDLQMKLDVLVNRGPTTRATTPT